MVNEVDEYMETVIGQGDRGSNILTVKTVPTLRNSPYVDVITSPTEKFPVLRLPSDTCVVAHTTSGCPGIGEPAQHTESLVDRLAKQAEVIGARPVAFANVVDSQNGKDELIGSIGDALRSGADKHDVAVLKGENAILGDMVHPFPANVSGTMVSIMPRKFYDEMSAKCGTSNGVATFDRPVDGIGMVTYAVMLHEDQAVFLSSDGIGTKTKVHMRNEKPEQGSHDEIAMKADDASKKGARVVISATLLEKKGRVDVERIKTYYDAAAFDYGFCGVVQYEDTPITRISGYSPNSPAFNMGGTVVCLIDEEQLKHPMTPKPGDKLIAIRGNGRSNGYTDRQKAAAILGAEWCKRHGVLEWHETPEGQDLLEYLARPSIVFYPAFRELTQKRLATMVTHMSGGAYEGKLAKILRAHGLYCHLKGLYPTNPWEHRLREALGNSVDITYRKWAMNNEGFAATADEARTIDVLRSHGLEAKTVATLEAAVGDRTGVQIEDITYLSGAPKEK